MSFETFTPIWSHVNQNGKNDKNPKFEFHNSLNNFGRPFLGVWMIFGEWIWSVLSDEISFEMFLPYGLMLTEMKTNRKKNKK